MKNVPYDIPNGKSNSGKIAVRFPNSSARDKGVKAIDDGTFLSDLGYNCRDVTKILPKVTLHDIPSFVLLGINETNKTKAQIRDEEKATIISEICAKNHVIHFRLFIWVKKHLGPLSQLDLKCHQLLEV